MSATNTPLTDQAVTHSEQAIKDLLSKLSVHEILKFQERMKVLHVRQLALVEEVLKDKGHANTNQ